MGGNWAYLDRTSVFKNKLAGDAEEGGLRVHDHLGLGYIVRYCLVCRG